MTRFSKLYIALKFRCLGLGYDQALKALEKARVIHDGMRKDNVTPEFQHQIEIALHIFTLSGVRERQAAIVCALLHDTPEDYPDAVPREWFVENFGGDNWRRLQWLNKNLWKDSDTYFYQLSDDPIAALVKGADRVNNFQSMLRGNFSVDKQARYAQEVADYFLPMLKAARKKFPDYIDAFYSLEFMLKSQLEFVLAYVELARKLPTGD